MPRGFLIPLMAKYCIEALLKLGHMVRVIDFQTIEENPEVFIKEIRYFNPDFVFSTKHFGLLGGFFDKRKIPHASWVVNYPYRPLHQTELIVSEYSCLIRI